MQGKRKISHGDPKDTSTCCSSMLKSVVLFSSVLCFSDISITNIDFHTCLGIVWWLCHQPNRHQAWNSLLTNINISIGSGEWPRLIKSYAHLSYVTVFQLLILNALWKSMLNDICERGYRLFLFSYYSLGIYRTVWCQMCYACLSKCHNKIRQVKWVIR